MRAQSIGLIFLLAVAGCSGGTGSGNVGTSAAPSEAATAAVSNAASPESSGSPIAAPTATADPNLLSVANGTILRSYSPALLDHINDGYLGNVAEGFGSEFSSDTKPPFVFTFALGTLAPAPAHLDPTGTYVVQSVPDANGSFVMAGTQSDLDGARFVAAGAGLTGTTCTNDAPIAPYVGQLTGRTWDAKFAGNKDANADTIHAVVNEDASIIAGISGERSIVFMRTAKPPRGCLARTNGTGAHHVLVLDQDPIPSFYPTDTNPPIAGYRFDAIG
ncbi:MAG: hypothetical protein ABSF08_05810, partial [Candidatus Cybelea sp.]